MRRLISLLLVVIMALSMVACGSTTAPAATEAPKAEAPAATEAPATEAPVTEPAAEPYKIGIVTPTLTVSEDEFRGAQEMLAKYPDIVVHKTLPEDFATNVEGCISVVTSLADDPQMK